MNKAFYFQLFKKPERLMDMAGPAVINNESSTVKSVKSKTKDLGSLRLVKL